MFIVNCSKKKGSRNKYVISFPYNKEMINNIKLINSSYRKYDKSSKSWVLNPRGLYTLIKFFKGSNKIKFEFFTNNLKSQFLKEIRKIDEEDRIHRETVKKLEISKKRWLKLKKEFKENHNKYWDLLHKNLKDNIKLYPHQIVAALFANEAKNVLFSMEMGSGKTGASIAYVEMNDFERVFVITPNSLKFNFYYEIETFTNSKAHIVNWKHNKYSIEEAKYVIVNYEYFATSDKNRIKKKVDDLKIGKIDCFIADECHRLKNQSSHTSKNIFKVFKSKIFRNNNESKIFLSGTPAPNRAFELYTVLNNINSIEFPTQKYFYEYFCGMEYGDYGWETNIDNQRLDELFRKIEPFSYRVKKSEVLPDLPDKIYRNVKMDLNTTQLRKYNSIERDTADELGLNNKNSLTTMVELQQFLSNEKIKVTEEIIDSALEEGKKIVIVDKFKDSLYQLYEKYKEVSVIHTGDQTVEERSESVKRFQNLDSEVKLFFGSIQTCNYGLTLTASDTLIILTQPYSVGEFDQVCDRLHRIGAKNNINIFVLIYNNTIDEYVFYNLESKRKEIYMVIDNEDYKSNITNSVLGDVIRKIKEKYSV